MSAAGIALSLPTSIFFRQLVHTPYVAGVDPGDGAIHLRQELAHVLLQRHVQFLAEGGRALVGHVVAIVVLAAHVRERLVAGLLQVREVLRQPIAIGDEGGPDFAEGLLVHEVLT